MDIRALIVLMVMLAGIWVYQPVAASQADAVYFVIYQNVLDEAQFEEYVQAVMPAITRRGGELVAAGTPTLMEGEFGYSRAVVFRYPSGAVLERFLQSQEYAEIRKLRDGAADWLAVIVPSLPVTRSDER